MSTLVRMMACRLLVTKLLSAPMLAYYRWHPQYCCASACQFQSDQSIINIDIAASRLQETYSKKSLETGLDIVIDTGLDIVIEICF